MADITKYDDLTATFLHIYGLTDGCRGAGGELGKNIVCILRFLFRQPGKGRKYSFRIFYRDSEERTGQIDMRTLSYYMKVALRSMSNETFASLMKAMVVHIGPFANDTVARFVFDLKAITTFATRGGVGPSWSVYNEGKPMDNRTPCPLFYNNEYYLSRVTDEGYTTSSLKNEYAVIGMLETRNQYPDTFPKILYSLLESCKNESEISSLIHVNTLHCNLRLLPVTEPHDYRESIKVLRTLAGDKLQ